MSTYGEVMQAYTDWRTGKSPRQPIVHQHGTYRLVDTAVYRWSGAELMDPDSDQFQVRRHLVGMPVRRVA